MTTFSNNPVQRQCYNSSLHQVTTIMLAPRSGMCGRWSTSSNRPSRTYWQAHTSVGIRMAGLQYQQIGFESKSTKSSKSNIYEATKGFWRYEGYFNEFRSSGSLGEQFQCVATLISPWKTCKMKLGRRRCHTVEHMGRRTRISTGHKEERYWTRPIGCS